LQELKKERAALEQWKKCWNDVGALATWDHGQMYKQTNMQAQSAMALLALT